MKMKLVVGEMTVSANGQEILRRSMHLEKRGRGPAWSVSIEHETASGRDDGGIVWKVERKGRSFVVLREGRYVVRETRWLSKERVEVIQSRELRRWPSLEKAMRAVELMVEEELSR